MSPRVYLAGQIAGLTYDGADDWRQIVRYDLSRDGIRVFSPLRGKEFLRGAGVLEGPVDAHPLSTAHGLTARDREDVRRADAVLMYLPTSERVSIGTMIEVGWADAWRVPIVLVTNADSLYASHPMVIECASYVVPELHQGVALIRSLLLP